MKKKRTSPPRWPSRLVSWFIKNKYLEEIEGDLQELYHDYLQRNGTSMAKMRYWLTTLRLLRPILIKKLEGNMQLNHYGLFKNHIKTAFRNFRRDLNYASINVMGLSLGIACCLTITLWGQNELQFDRFHEKGEQLYQVLRDATYSGGERNTVPGTAYPIGDALVAVTPEILSRTRYAEQGAVVVEANETMLERKLLLADPEFLTLLSYPLSQGIAPGCLEDPASIVISESMAATLFPEGGAMGETAIILNAGEKMEFVITGIMKPIPLHSTLQFDMIIPIGNYLPFNPSYESWGNSWLHTLVLLDENASVEIVNDKVAGLPQEMADLEWFKLNLQPYEDKYLYNEFADGQPVGGKIDQVKLFTAVAVFTLIIACFNFVNLTTARAVRRSKEVAIKKIIGAKKRSLMGQFLVESSLLALISLIVAVVFTQTSLPYFNALAGSFISLDFTQSGLYLLLGSILGTVILLSGIYPALFLSSFQPLKAIKGKIAPRLSQKRVMGTLTVMQFTLAMMLITATLLINDQLEFLLNKKLGFDKEHVVILNLDATSYEHRQVMADQLLQQPGVLAVSGSGIQLGSETIGRSSDPRWAGKSNEESHWFSIFTAGHGLLELLDIQIMQGRHFSHKQVSDSLNFIINEKAARQMGLDNPIGAPLSLWGEEGQIVGVIKDFHFESLHQEVFPMVIRCRPSEVSTLFIKLQGGKTASFLPFLTDLHGQFSSLPANISFLDEDIAMEYQQDRVIQKLSGVFSSLAVVISCLGLLGLAAFGTRQRSREVAIRKVLGARLGQLFALLFKHPFQLIFIGAVIGIPITHLWLSDWLNNFAYSIELHWYDYLIPIGLILLLALLTIGRLGYKVASGNPVNALQQE